MENNKGSTMNKMKVYVSPDGDNWEEVVPHSGEHDKLFGEPSGLSKWCCHPFGISTMKWVPLEKDTPNWWWRIWQYIFFGNRWKKNES